MEPLFFQVDGIRHQIPWVKGYQYLFKDRLLFVTGVGRSGTSMVGKFLGSMKNVFYVFEPTLVKFCLHPDALLALLWEDVIMPAVQGRNLNMDPETESWSGWYWREVDLREQWKLKRREEVIQFLEENKVLFVIKATEYQGMYKYVKDIFPGVRFLEVVRNGLEVISSAVKPRWHDDGYGITKIADWVEIVHGGEFNWLGIPWYVAAEDRVHWERYNIETRNACVWRNCIESAPAGDPNYKHVKYEDVYGDPHGFIEWCRAEYGVEPTGLTIRYANATREFVLTQHPDLTEKIQEPEKAKFFKCMKGLGWA